MATDTGYAQRDYLRICDVCNHRFHFSQLTPIGELRWACKDDAPGLTATQVSRINARARPLKVKPNKWAKPVSQVPDYQASEAACFNFIAQAAPANTIGGTTSMPAAAYAAIYMADIVIQGKRPAAWIATAKAVLRSCMAALLASQYGSGVSPAGSPQNPRYGGLLESIQYNASTAIVAGVAFVKAYEALGDYTYLLAADRVATFLRHAQCGDLQASQGTVYPSLGAPYHIGGVASSVSDTTGLQSASYNVSDIAALWFLALLVAVRSPSTIYGDGTATGFFSAATAAPLSQMISEMLAFASSGARSTVTGTLVSGMATAAWASGYTACIAGTAGGGTWTYGSTISGAAVALATRGVFEAAGLTAQVSEILSWLASFAPNPANAVPAQPASVTIAGNKGTYDPSLCVATLLSTSAPFMEATGTTYGWTAYGILSPVLVAAGIGLRRAKDTLASPQRRSTTSVDLVYLGPQGQSGLSLQPTGTPTVVSAAGTGMIFRQPPGIYPRVALY